MELEARIERLERERWLYLMLAVLGAITGLVGVTLAALKASKSEFSVNSVTVTDGTSRAILGVDATRGLGLQLYSGSYLRGSFALDKGGNPQLSVYDATAKRRQVMTVDSLGPSVQLLGTDDKPRLELRAEGTGGVVSVYDALGNRTHQYLPKGPTATQGAPAPVTTPVNPATKTGS